LSRNEIDHLQMGFIQQLLKSYNALVVQLHQIGF